LTVGRHLRQAKRRVKFCRALVSYLKWVSNCSARVMFWRSADAGGLPQKYGRRDRRPNTTGDGASSVALIS